MYPENLTAINDVSPVSEADITRARDRYGSLYLRELLARQLSARLGSSLFQVILVFLSCGHTIRRMDPGLLWDMIWNSSGISTQAEV